ncbi:flavodoxin family protein [Cryptosporidium andersoni]|uniref:NADPH--hemoprotein reductase n=1 Tax=Cryptosporidium andersoni TaxID=117008 RepID=A0A1J4MU08_9CRYT|nr:flavodoxin family protein [Cryptosporidium andersoni]
MQNIQIYFATETGNSEQIANTLANKLRSLNVTNSVHDIYYLNPSDLIELKREIFYIIFVVSTCGQGCFPYSIQKLIRWLKKHIKQGNKVLRDMSYTIIGLGSSLYEDSFNLAAKKLDKYFRGLGAKKFCECGEIDEVKNNVSECLLWWDEVFFPFIKRNYTLDEYQHCLDYIQINLEPKSFTCKIYFGVPGDNLTLNNNNIQEGECYISRKYFALSAFAVKEKTLLCKPFKIGPQNFRKTFQLTLLPTYSCTYKTFDLLDVLPSNTEDIIVKFSKRIFNIDNIDKLNNITISLTPNDQSCSTYKVPFPTPCSLTYALKYYFDIITIPPKEVLLQFTPFVTEQNEKRIIEDDYFHQLLTKFYKLSLLDYIYIFLPSLKYIPIEKFLTFFGMRQKFRTYSISSSSSVSKNDINITVSTYTEGPYASLSYAPSVINPKYLYFRDLRVQYYNGTCSNFLFTLKENSSYIYGQIRKSSLDISSFMLKAPLILITHGTGIAPIRALLNEIGYIKMKNRSVKLGPIYLFYGCRTAEDILYNNELIYFKESGVLERTFFAFSKSCKRHVQDILIEKEQEITDFLKNIGTYIYICGSPTFTVNVKKTLSCIGKKNEIDHDIVEKLSREKRIYTETWN